MEVWRQISDFEGYYEISNYGNVRSVDRFILCEYGDLLLNGEYISPKLNSSGYLQVALFKNGTRTMKYIHRLVAYEFILWPDDVCIGVDVNHKDGNKRNNHYKNLEWVSKKQNHEHAVFNKLISRNNKGFFIRSQVDPPVFRVVTEMANC